MKQKTRLAWMLGGTAATSLALVIAACTTDNGTSPLPTTNATDSGKTTPKRDTGTNTSGGPIEEEEEDDAGTKVEAGDCSKVPRLRNDPGVYCFREAIGALDGGNCPTGQACCSDVKNGTKFASKCIDPEDGCKFETFADTDLEKGRQWDCTHKAHCTGDDVCCVIAGDGGTPRALDNKDFPGCGAYENGGDNYRFVGGTRCKASCGNTELTLCASDAECPNGKKCKFFELSNRQTGVCQ